MPSNLPPLEKTWQFSVNNPVIGATNSGTSHARMIRKLWQILEDEIDGTHFFATGSALSVGGTHGGYNPGTTALAPATVGNLVGKKGIMRGATTAANNGEFVITHHEDAGGGIYQVRWVNASAVGETLTAGSFKAIGRVGFSFPWKVWYTGRSGVGATTAGDGVDRMITLALSDFNTTTNSAYQKILYQPATGTQWLWKGNVASAGQRGCTGDWARAIPAPFTYLLQANQQAQTYPNATPTATRPDGTSFTSTGTNSQSGAFASNSNWFNGDVTETVSLFNSLIHVMMSSDGKHTRALLGYNGAFQTFLYDEEVKNSIGMGANTNITGKVCSQSTTGHGAEYSRLNDVSNASVGRLNVDRFTVDYDLATAYWTAEGYGSAANGQNIVVRNAISGNQPMYRIGLHTDGANLLAQARFGELKDIYYTHDAVPPGTTFPNDSSRQWLCIGAIMVPWPGVVPEFTF